jgi:hypothetical protein
MMKYLPYNLFLIVHVEETEPVLEKMKDSDDEEERADSSKYKKKGIVFSDRKAGLPFCRPSSSSESIANSDESQSFDMVSYSDSSNFVELK